MRFEFPLILRKSEPGRAGRAVFPVLDIPEPLFAVNPSLFTLIFERPGLGAAVLEAVVEPQAGFGMDGIEHYVDVGIFLVVVGDEHGLMLVPLHMAKEPLGRFDHMLARGIVFG